jgi:hypothetical protein
MMVRSKELQRECASRQQDDPKSRMKENMMSKSQSYGRVENAKKA